MRRLVLVFALLLAGCGAASGEFDTSPAPTDAASKRAAAAVALRYVRALVAQDWATACETRITQEQQRLADAGGGSCASAFAKLFKERPTTDRYVGVRSARCYRGPYAGIDMIARTSRGPRITLGAVRQNGEWRLKDLPKLQVP